MHDEHPHVTSDADPEAVRAAKQIYRLWDEALGARDVETAAALYAPDAMLESPLVRHLLHSDRGIVQGRDALRDFIRMAFERTPPSRRRFRTGFFTDGKKLIWEYPRATPGEDQMDFAESMEIENGLIRRHCVYWGWFGVKVLEEDRYRH